MYEAEAKINIEDNKIWRFVHIFLEYNFPVEWNDISNVGNCPIHE